MKKNDVNSCKLPKCYPVSYDSHAYTKPRMTENFTADDTTPSLLLSESSFQETLTTLFPDQKYAILGGVIVVLIIIILFMLLSGGGNRHHRRHRRRDDDDDDDN
jgi:hypothetical protein